MATTPIPAHSRKRQRGDDDVDAGPPPPKRGHSPLPNTQGSSPAVQVRSLIYDVIPTHTYCMYCNRSRLVIPDDHVITTSHPQGR